MLMAWLRRVWASRKKIPLSYALFWVAVAVGLLSTSLTTPYRECDAHREEQRANAAKNGGPWTFGDTMATPFVCFSEFVHKKEAAVTAGATVFLAFFTLALWRSTVRLWTATRDIVGSAEKTTKDQLSHAREVERAYFAGGGECYRDNSGMPRLNKDGHREFRFEVGNHGKTTAFMEAYDIQFVTLDEVCRRHIPFDPGTFVDQFPPGERSRPTDAPIAITRADADVAFGTVLYKDIWGTDHYSRFILRIAKNGQTHSNVPGIDSAYYRKWT